MEIGIGQFAAILPDPATGRLPSPTDRMPTSSMSRGRDPGRTDVFGIGEHHRAEFLDSAPAVILAAAAARTSQIRLTSAVTVLSAPIPCGCFRIRDPRSDFKGRAELRRRPRSFGEAYPLFGSGYARL